MQTVLIGGPGHRRVVNLPKFYPNYQVPELVEDTKCYPPPFPPTKVEGFYNTYNYTLTELRIGNCLFLVYVLDSLGNDDLTVYLKEHGLITRIVKNATESWR